MFQFGTILLPRRYFNKNTECKSGGLPRSLGFVQVIHLVKSPWKESSKGGKQTNQIPTSKNIAPVILENSKTALSIFIFKCSFICLLIWKTLSEFDKKRASTRFFLLLAQGFPEQFGLGASYFALLMCQGLNSEPSGCHGGLQKRKSKEELGHHKATRSSILAVVICGTGNVQMPLFHTSASISKNAAKSSVCINLWTWYNKTFRLCLCLLQTDVPQRCPLKRVVRLRAAIRAENTLHAFTSCTYGTGWHAFTKWAPVVPRYYVLSFLSAAFEGLWNMGGHENAKRKECIRGAHSD